jgi:hypothetical protein
MLRGEVHHFRRVVLLNTKKVESKVAKGLQQVRVPLIASCIFNGLSWLLELYVVIDWIFDH